jgi:hypothetical protein
MVEKTSKRPARRASFFHADFIGFMIDLFALAGAFKRQA